MEYQKSSEELGRSVPYDLTILPCKVYTRSRQARNVHLSTSVVGKDFPPPPLSNTSNPELEGALVMSDTVSAERIERVLGTLNTKFLANGDASDTGEKNVGAPNIAARARPSVICSEAQ